MACGLMFDCSVMQLKKEHDEVEEELKRIDDVSEEALAVYQGLQKVGS